MLNATEAAAKNMKLALKLSGQLYDRVYDPKPRKLKNVTVFKIDPAARPWKRPPHIAKVRVRHGNVSSRFGMIKVDR